KKSLIPFISMEDCSYWVTSVRNHSFHLDSPGQSYVMERVVFLVCQFFFFLPLMYSVYNTLQCAGCLCLVGVILYSTPEHLSALRNLFLLKKDQMYCYIFSTGQMVKASTLDFSVAPLGERLSEVRIFFFLFFTLHVDTRHLFPP
uniref:Protein yippee-like n=1 Tax=Oncorhynchus mykiss TaxID=8022 RepID=A0A8C7TBN8_ONCMY